MCGGSGLGRAFGDILNTFTFGLIGSNSADKELRKAQQAQADAQNAALREQQAIAAAERQKAEASAAAQEQLTQQRKAKAQESFLTSAAGDESVVTKKSFLGAG